MGIGYTYVIHKTMKFKLRYLAIIFYVYLPFITVYKKKKIKYTYIKYY